MADIIDPVVDLPLPTVAVDETGLFTPAAAFALEMNRNIINATWDLASTKSTALDAAVDDLTNDATGWLATHGAGDITAPDISITAPVEPSITPAAVSTALVFSNYTTQAGAIITALTGKFSDFMTEWFPDDAAAFDAAQAWITAAIGNTTTGAIPADIKDAMLEDSRAQLLAEETRAVADLYDGQAAKRSRFPTGAQSGMARRITQATLNAIAASSRTIMLKDFELTHSDILEAVKMALSARSAAMSAAVNYVQTVVAGYGQGAMLTSMAHESETRMIGAAAGYFGARIHAGDLALKVLSADKQLEFEAAKANQAKDINEIERYVQAFEQRTKLLAAEVVSMLNNLRAGGTISYSASA